MSRFGNLKVTIIKKGNIMNVATTVPPPPWFIHFHAYLQICFEAAQPEACEHGEPASKATKLRFSLTFSVCKMNEHSHPRV